MICAASTVNFALRTPQEQMALVGVFARWLHSLTGPAQILVRSEDIDVAPLISGLHNRAPSLPHPALERAATEHAEFLTGLAGRRDLLRSQVLIVLREPRGRSPGLPQRPARGSIRGPVRDSGAGQRVLRRADETARALSPAGINLRVLSGGEAAAVLASCCNPLRATPAHAAAWQAAPADVITGGAQ